MNAESILSGTANLFLALGDKTRLRLLNLMRDREICISSFTEVLGQSQPKISRHLAYLRNSGIVAARRDGKWIHYSISTDLDDNSRRLLSELFKWMETQDGLRTDRDKTKGTSPKQLELPIEAEQKPRRERAVRSKRQVAMPEPERKPEPEPEPEYYPSASHNELEDFLL